MPTPRAELSSISPPELAGARVPLTGRKREGSVEPEAPLAIKPPAGQSTVVAFPSLDAPTREVMVSKSYRIPLSLHTRLKEVCKAKGIDESPLIRDFISAGLDSIATRA